MAKYTVRTEQVADGWVTWIDLDGQICIRQENAPGKDGFFATEADASAWGNEHATMLEESYHAGLAAEARKKEAEDAQHAANLAAVETAAQLKIQNEALLALVAKLTSN
jgi:hypothetical protein